jgi:prepilin-type N-terminal cleavage/methylation domain-containing protein
MKGRRGVTLIELLVAMTLFSLLSAAVLYSLRTGLGSLGRVRERVAMSRREIGAERAFDLLVSGMMRTTVFYQQPGLESMSKAFFFQGDPQLMRFVTANSLEGGVHGFPQVVEIAAVPRENNDGFRLVAQERPYTSPFVPGSLIAGQFLDPVLGYAVMRFRPFASGGRLFVLSDRLRSVRFEYLEKLDFTPAVWRPQWIQNAYWPAAVRIVQEPRRTLVSEIHVHQPFQ